MHKENIALFTLLGLFLLALGLSSINTDLDLLTPIVIFSGLIFLSKISSKKGSIL